MPALRRVLLAAVVVLLGAVPSHALTVGGPVCNDTTWRVVDSPIVVTLPVAVGGPPCPPDAFPTLTIEPGVTVRFAASTGIGVYRELVARGTPEAPIVFTAHVGPPSPRYWFGITFYGTSVDATFDEAGNYLDGSILEHCVVEYLRDPGGINGGIAVLFSAPYLNDVTVQHGLFVSAAIGFVSPPDIRLRGIRVLANTAAYGLRVRQAQSVTIDDADVSVNSLTAFGASIQCDELTLRSSRVAANTAHGIELDCTQAAVSDVEIIANGGIGLSANDPATLSLLRLGVDGNASHGITGAVSGGPATSIVVQDSIVTNNQGDGISLGGSGTVTIVNDTVRANFASGVRAGAAAITIAGNTIADTVGPGLVITGGSGVVSGNCLSSNGGAATEGAAAQFNAGTVLFQTNTVAGNDGEALLVGELGAAVITQNNLIHAGAYALRNRRAGATSAIDATGNWWGTIDAPTIASRVYDCLTDAAVGCVQHTPFATGPVPAAPDIAACATPPPTTTSSTSTTSSTTVTSSSTISTTSSSSSSSTVTTTTSTSSTTSTSRSTTTSTSSTSTSTRTTSTSSTVTTSTSTSVTTTVPHCGNGVVEPELGEECDPQAHGGRSCCLAACQPIQGSAGGSCGDANPLGPCDDGDTCDGSGVCRRNQRGTDQQCRFPHAEGLCDLGDACDGVSPDCPRAGVAAGCVVQRPAQAPGAAAVTAGCTVPRSVPGEGRPRCELRGFAPAGTGELAVCGPTPLTATRIVKPRRRTGPDQRTGTAKLPLTGAGRRLLRQQGSLPLCVRTRIKIGGRILREETAGLVLTRVR